MIYGDCAVLVLSCDKYRDLWDPFFKQFWKYWPDCPYKIYLGTNEVSYKNKGITTVLSGKDSNWSESYRKILNQIPEKNLFIWMEDAFITSKVNASIFSLCFDFFQKKQANHIHFRPVPKPDKTIENNFGMYQKGMPYRATVIGFWKKDYLEKLLVNGENAWNFEIMGSYRTSFDEGFYCLLKPAIRYIHMVEKGKWIKTALIYCKKNNIDIDVNARQSAQFSLISPIKDLYYTVMLNKPWAFRVKLMNLLRKLIVSY